jgi:hypothetical protein
MLKHPAYAGAYTYGKRHNVRVPGAERKVVTRALPMEEWPVLIRDAFPGYITWEQYLANQEQLRENAQGTNWSKGAPRSGIALLQGIVFCGRCGRSLHTRYSNQPAYVCEQMYKTHGEPICQNFMVPHIDEAVTRVFLEAIQPAHLEVALAAIEQIEEQRQRLSEQWQQRLERAHYEAELARRRYEQVDPDNRLVAGELERRWEEKLQAQQSVEQEWAQAQERELAPLTEDDKETIRRLAEDVPALWYAETTTMAERKRLLRCLIQDVTLDAFTKPGFSIIRICWHTGTTTVIEAERPRSGCRTPREVVARLRELAQYYTDDQIADTLNAEQIPTATGMTWNKLRVQAMRKAHNVPTRCPYYTKAKGPRGDGLIAVSEAAERLGSSRSMIHAWFRQGLIEGHQREKKKALWVRLTEDDVKRLNGSTPLRPGLVEICEAARILGITTEQVWEQVRAQQLVPYRLVIKNRWRWCVQLSAEPVGRATEP